MRYLQGTSQVLLGYLAGI